MKKVILFLFVALSMTMIACSNSGEKSATEQAPSVSESGPAQPQFNVQTNQDGDNTTLQVVDNSGGEKHYICPKGCEGSGGDSGGTCPTCGSTYVHNAAFHAQQQSNTISTDPNGANSIMTNPQLQNPEPAQNANGIWHYTCPNGCSGGGGSAGPCSSCGATLVHNTTYHQ